MKQLGTLAFTGKTIQQVIDRYGTRKRGQTAAHAWPLDVGPMTVNEISAANPHLNRKTIYQRLCAGTTKYAELIKPVPEYRATPTKKVLAFRERRRRAQNAARIIQEEKAAHLAAKKAAHKQL